MSKYIAIVCSTLALSACVDTPRPTTTYTDPNANLKAEINETQGNIYRGYAVHESREPYACEKSQARWGYIGSIYTIVGTDYYPSTCYRNVENPVTIDIKREQAKLKRLQNELDRRLGHGAYAPKTSTSTTVTINPTPQNNVETVEAIDGLWWYKSETQQDSNTKVCHYEHEETGDNYNMKYSMQLSCPKSLSQKGM